MFETILISMGFVATIITLVVISVNILSRPNRPLNLRILDWVAKKPRTDKGLEVKFGKKAASAIELLRERGLVTRKWNNNTECYLSRITGYGETHRRDPKPTRRKSKPKGRRQSIRGVSAEELMRVTREMEGPVMDYLSARDDEGDHILEKGGREGRVSSEPASPPDLTASVQPEEPSQPTYHTDGDKGASESAQDAAAIQTWANSGKFDSLDAAFEAYFPSSDEQNAEGGEKGDDGKKPDFCVGEPAWQNPYKKDPGEVLIWKVPDDDPSPDPPSGGDDAVSPEPAPPPDLTASVRPEEPGQPTYHTDGDKGASESAQDAAAIQTRADSGEFNSLGDLEACFPSSDKKNAEGGGEDDGGKPDSAPPAESIFAMCMESGSRMGKEGIPAVHKGDDTPPSSPPPVLECLRVTPPQDPPLIHGLLFPIYTRKDDPPPVLLPLSGNILSVIPAPKVPERLVAAPPDYYPRPHISKPTTTPTFPNKDDSRHASSDKPGDSVFGLFPDPNVRR